MKILEYDKLPQEIFDQLQYPSDGNCTDLVVLSKKQADDYYTAAYECFKMVDDATEYVIKNDLYHKLGIPDYMKGMIDHTYYNYKIHPHMLGRFDFAGGLDDIPIKLIEFNADTPFTLFESGPLQYTIAKHYNHNPDVNQYNTLYEALEEYFHYLSNIKKDIYPVFVSANANEDKFNLDVIKYSCENMAMFNNPSITWEEFGIDELKGFSRIKDDNIVDSYNCLVKMVPWDMILSLDENMSREIIKTMERFLHEYDYDIIVCNPLYSLVYQSKGLLPILSELYPNSPYLLKSEFYNNDEVDNCFLKPVFGREGQSIIKVVNGQKTKIDGYYDDNIYISQEIAHFARHKDKIYQAGVFVSMEEPCCISFRRSKSDIITCNSEICGHIISED